MTSRRKPGEEASQQLETTVQAGEDGMETAARPPRDDRGNIALLLFLYLLQGIPLGLAGSIPMILQQRHVSYKDQATFSLSFWPFSIKLLWAPLVDSMYWPNVGRRKSWLVPAQYLIGVFMLVLSGQMDTLMGEDTGQPPDVTFMTLIFFALNFLAATQDIAVDGWAITMLHRDNVGWASTCNSVGQTAGYFLGYVVFLALESHDFCVNYLGAQGSLVTLPGFLYFWGIMFCITTTCIWLFKTEDPEIIQDGEDLGLVATYKVLTKVLYMKNIQRLILVLLTCKIGFAAADSLTVLKLVEAGVPRDRLALLSIPLTPIQILLPLYISRYTSGPRPMNTFMFGYPFRLVIGLMFAVLVWATPSLQEADGSFPTHFYLLVILVYVIHQVFANCMFVGVMAFFARISDTSVGGTYMTLLNTFTNLGGNWPSWVALRFVSELTWTSCKVSAPDPDSPTPLTCSNDHDEQACLTAGGECLTLVDGYYLESVGLVVLGLLWMRWGMPLIRQLQDLPHSAWSVTRHSRTQ